MRPSYPRPVRRERRALSHVGGALKLRGGSAEERRVLEYALDVSGDEQVVMAHVHGFHPYPARLHPQLAARLIGQLSRPGDQVLDPFCGSGTSLVEARLGARGAVGVDANPLAIELAWLKTGGLTPSQFDDLLTKAREVTAHAELRRLERAGPSRRYGKADRNLFGVHVLLELDGLRQGLQALPRDDPVRRALGLVLSSLLTKVSHRRADTDQRLVPPRLAAGYTIRLFQQRTELLVRQLREFYSLLPAGAPQSAVRLGDARSLAGFPSCSVDLVITSPPYPGVYDYYEQHAVRLRWLGLDGRGFARQEIGAKRDLGTRDYDRAVRQWERDFGACLRALRRVIRPQGAMVLVLADSVLGGRAVRGDATLQRLAPLSGFELVTIASQLRPHFHAASEHAFRDAGRAEHVALLQPRSGAVGGAGFARHSGASGADSSRGAGTMGTLGKSGAVARRTAPSTLGPAPFLRP